MLMNFKIATETIQKEIKKIELKIRKEDQWVLEQCQESLYACNWSPWKKDVIEKCRKIFEEIMSDYL